MVLPAYNAARTLPAVVASLPMDIVDDVVLVDDASRDDTVAVATALGLTVELHPQNRGYGGNQKSCYRLAISRGADVIVMFHPDGQYDARAIPAMASLIASGRADVVLGSRVLGRGARANGMPLWRYLGNMFLTVVQNVLLQRHLSEWHTGLRAYSRAALSRLPLAENSDDFIFDNQLLVQAVWFGLEIGEVSAPATYGPDSSSIAGRRALVYALGVLRGSVAYRLARWGIGRGPG